MVDVFRKGKVELFDLTVRKMEGNGVILGCGVTFICAVESERFTKCDSFAE